MGTDARDRLRDVRLVVMDVDGTVRASDDPTCSRSADALRRLDAAGIPWTFSTGRPHGSMRRATADLFVGGRPRRATSNCNGGIVHVPGDRPTTEVRLLSREALSRVLAIATAERMGAVVFSCEVAHGLPVETVRLAGFHPDATRVGEHWPGVLEAHDPSLGHDGAVTSVVLLAEGVPSMGAVSGLQDRLGGQVTVSTSGWTAFEVSDRGVSKGASLVDLATHFGCHPDQVMAIGDGVNDVPMLRAAGVGVAVGNAPPPVMEAADLVTEGRAGHGVAEAVRALLDARRDQRGRTWSPR